MVRKVLVQHFVLDHRWVSAAEAQKDVFILWHTEEGGMRFWRRPAFGTLHAGSEMACEHCELTTVQKVQRLTYVYMLPRRTKQCSFLSNPENHRSGAVCIEHHGRFSDISGCSHRANILLVRDSKQLHVPLLLTVTMLLDMTRKSSQQETCHLSRRLRQDQAEHGRKSQSLVYQSSAPVRLVLQLGYDVRLHVLPLVDPSDLR